MNISIYIKSRSDTYSAEGIYSDGSVTVLKGAKVHLGFATHIRGGNTAKNFRSNKAIVDESGQVLVDCSFASPSTAAQFVTGRSSNGYEAWKVDAKTSLGKFLGREKSK